MRALWPPSLPALDCLAPFPNPPPAAPAVLHQRRGDPPPVKRRGGQGLFAAAPVQLCVGRGHPGTQPRQGWKASGPAGALDGVGQAAGAHICLPQGLASAAVAGERTLMCIAKALVSRADQCNAQEVSNSREHPMRQPPAAALSVAAAAGDATMRAPVLLCPCQETSLRLKQCAAETVRCPDHRSVGLCQARPLRPGPDEHDGGRGHSAHRRVQVATGLNLSGARCCCLCGWE